MVSVPRLRLVLPNPSRNIHARAFDEVALSLVGGLRSLGIEFEVTYRCRQGDARVLVLAPHLQDLEDLRRLNRDAILYTWEQVASAEGTVLRGDLIDVMQEFVIWDYSHRNAAVWREVGMTRVTPVPLGYEPSLKCMPKAEGCPELDVLFYGSVNDRRRRILDDLERRGLRVGWLFGKYGNERDAWIRRSRIVLNLHYYSGQILELPRLSYLWVNRVPLVAEVGPDTEDILDMAGAMLSAPYDGLVDLVVEALEEPSLMDRAVQASYDRFTGGATMAQNISTAFSAEVE